MVGKVAIWLAILVLMAVGVADGVMAYQIIVSMDEIYHYVLNVEKKLNDYKELTSEAKSDALLLSHEVKTKARQLEQKLSQDLEELKKQVKEEVSAAGKHQEEYISALGESDAIHDPAEGNEAALRMHRPSLPEPIHVADYPSPDTRKHR